MKKLLRTTAPHVKLAGENATIQWRNARGYWDYDRMSVFEYQPENGERPNYVQLQTKGGRYRLTHQAAKLLALDLIKTLEGTEHALKVVEVSPLPAVAYWSNQFTEDQGAA